MNHPADNEPDTRDIETRIADAERTVIETDQHFLRSTRELATAMRGQAGKAVGTSAVTVAALVTGLVVYRLVSHRRRSRRERRDRFVAARYGTPRDLPRATARPTPRSGVAGFIGEAVGSTIRASALPRPASLFATLVAPILSVLLRKQRGPYR